MGVVAVGSLAADRPRRVGVLGVVTVVIVAAVSSFEADRLRRLLLPLLRRDLLSLLLLALAEVAAPAVAGEVLAPDWPFWADAASSSARLRSGPDTMLLLLLLGLMLLLFPLPPSLLRLRGRAMLVG